MQKAENILQAIHKMGEKHIPLTRVYRSLFSEDLYLTAYAKIYKNDGALTPGSGGITADGTSMKTIRRIIEQLRYERFRFHPVRRAYADKKQGGKRPLGMPDFPDKLVQEALRLMLEAYYEPRFRESSHGFRSDRGFHTALKDIKEKFTGTTWFIEGDIKGCFDNIDHDILMAILARDIHDGRLLNLIRLGLEAGVVEDWQYHPNESGVPQGGILSPLLANIYLHELDVFIEGTLIPEVTRGDNRRKNPEYDSLTGAITRAGRKGDWERVALLKQQRNKLPSVDTQDPNFRRLKYVRYADDFLLGFVGTKAEARQVKAKIGVFLKEHLNLEMSETKTLITHARSDYAQFLGYSIRTNHDDGQMTRGKDGIRRRNVNGIIRLGIPYGRIDERCKEYMKKGKPIHIAPLIHYSDAHIIDAYQNWFRGIAGYYKYATDRHKLSKLKYAMEISLVKTLAHKYKTSVRDIYRRYHGYQVVNGRKYKTLQVDVPTKHAVRTIYWGAIPLRTQTDWNEPLKDAPRYRSRWISSRSDLIQRLQANTCELCGSTQDVEVHHVRKLADLKKRWAGQKEKPKWVETMIALRRKTLVVCYQCHVSIHAGRPTPTNRVNESGRAV
jgi:group II intron reverse transcriptase/maturase